MKMLKKTYHILLSLMTAALLLPSLTACNAVVDGEEVERVENVNYINLTLYVSSGETVTRAPNGGEDGDAREAGFNRENTVSGITLILYKGTGIDDATATVHFVKYYPVSLVNRDAPQTTYTFTSPEYTPEAKYTTGDQKVALNELEFDQTYHVLIVANQNVSPLCYKGRPISEVRELTMNNVYSLSNASQPWNAQQFVMTTERDATIDFSSVTQSPKAGVPYGVVYNVTQPVVIERMSARIDYNTKGSTYKESRKGYEYSVGTTGDKFVVTKVTPFNLYNEYEYLFKRVQNTWTGTPTTSYLGLETAGALGNFVVDTKTSLKDNTNTLSYSNIITDVNTTLSAEEKTGTTSLTQVMESVQSTSLFTVDGNKNVIIAYPKENTLKPESHLMKYATGIAFSVDYYNSGNGTNTPDERRIYYYFLRHQGELGGGVYQAVSYSDLTGTESCGTLPMNFGIVRNNIYRVSIEGMSEDAKLKLNIKVKKWDIFEHAPIYM